MRLRSLVAIAALGIASLLFFTDQAHTQQPSSPGSGNHYVDPAVCATCHPAAAAGFQKTGMGQSFRRLQPGNVIEDLSAKPFYHAPSDTYLVMLSRGGKYYQRRWQIGFDGKETNVDEKQVDYVLGSGNHSRTYLHLTSRHTLQELPLAWYAEKGGQWAMNPGFDRPDYPGSTRLVTYECMFCHNAYPGIPKGHEEAGATPEFLLPLPGGIDCQRCHGPGQGHIQAATRPGASSAEIRASIVNPKRLSPEREMEVCMQCHLETTSSALPHAIRRLDRGPFSYVPGEPLGEFHLTFDRAGGMGDRFEIAHAAYRLRQSQCFLKSGGKLRCTTCHDPHNIPRGEAATLHYNAICRDCHRSVIAPASAGRHTPEADCISCHMPKRRTDDVVHVVMTDHFIRRRRPAGDLLADKAEERESAATAYRDEVVPYYPAKLGATLEEASLYSAMAQVREQSNLKEGLPKLASLIAKYHPQRADYYVDMAEGLKAAGRPAEALPYFEEAVRHAPGSAIVLRKLGSAQMESALLPQAEATLRRVVVIAPQDGGAWGMLAQVLARENRAAEAKAAFAKGIAVDPELPELHGSLGSFLLASGDAAGAEKEFREAVRIEPGVARAQANLASLLASRSAFAEARYHFEGAIHLKPDDAETRLNYARMLVSMGKASDAEQQVRAAANAAPNLAGAHELWGALLATRGDTDAALGELQAAVRLQPDFGRAQFELGVVLGRKGDFAASLEHLKLAAQSSDADARASAQQLLQKLGR